MTKTIGNKTANDIIFDLKSLEYLQRKSDIIYINEIRASKEDLQALRNAIITKQIMWLWQEYNDGYNIITFD